MERQAIQIFLLLPKSDTWYLLLYLAFLWHVSFEPIHSWHSNNSQATATAAVHRHPMNSHVTYAPRTRPRIRLAPTKQSLLRSEPSSRHLLTKTSPDFSVTACTRKGKLQFPTQSQNGRRSRSRSRSSPSNCQRGPFLTITENEQLGLRTTIPARRAACRGGAQLMSVSLCVACDLACMYIPGPRGTATTPLQCRMRR